MLTDISSQASQVNIIKLHQLKVACNWSKYTIALKPIHIFALFSNVSQIWTSCSCHVVLPMAQVWW